MGFSRDILLPTLLSVLSWDPVPETPTVAPDEGASLLHCTQKADSPPCVASSSHLCLLNQLSFGWSHLTEPVHTQASQVSESPGTRTCKVRNHQNVQRIFKVILLTTDSHKWQKYNMNPNLHFSFMFVLPKPHILGSWSHYYFPYILLPSSAIWGFF